MKLLINLFIGLSLLPLNADELEKEPLIPKNNQMKHHCARVMGLLFDNSSTLLMFHQREIKPDVLTTFNRIWSQGTQREVSKNDVVSTYRNFLQERTNENREIFLNTIVKLQLIHLKNYLHFFNNPDEIIDLTQEVYKFWLIALSRIKLDGTISEGVALTSISFLDLRIEAEILNYILLNYGAIPNRRISAGDWDNLKKLRNILTNPLFSEDSLDDISGDSILRMRDEESQIEFVPEMSDELSKRQFQKEVKESNRMMIISNLTYFIKTNFPLTIKIPSNANQVEITRINQAMTRNKRYHDFYFNRHLKDNPDTLEEIARRHDISRERARQVESALLYSIKRFLLRSLKSNDLHEFFD